MLPQRRLIFWWILPNRRGGKCSSFQDQRRHLLALVASLLTRRDCNRESKLWGSAKVHSHVDLCEGYIPTWRSNKSFAIPLLRKP
ncbi:putative methyltransferase tdiE [Fusarium oxysporum f. sp. albedinis]|nr:putative methyltransferase tdiE [Fusarium oxysporum f. sp. albedinis]